MRTEEQFNAAIERVRWYHGFHKQPCWLVPVENGYRVVKTAPKPEELPSGTHAVQYGPGMVELASVGARR